jgi:uncharacterized protein (TIGR03437 family)
VQFYVDNGGGAVAYGSPVAILGTAGANSAISVNFIPNPALPVGGTYKISAAFLNTDPNNLPSNSLSSTFGAQFIQTTVQQVATTTTITNIADPDSTSSTQIGRIITISAQTQVNHHATTTVIPGGTFTFNFPQGAVMVNTVTPSPAGCGNLANGGTSATVNSTPGSQGIATASCTFIITAPVPPNTNTNSYTVTYNGDTNTVTSTSAASAITTILAATTTTLAVPTDLGNDPVAAMQIGRLVTLSASTATGANVFANPGGSFTFNFPQGAVMVNNTTQAGACGNLVTNGTSATVTATTPSVSYTTGGNGSATATCTFIITAPVQTNTYTVTYNPDASTATSTSSSQSITTVKATTTTQFTVSSADPNSSTFLGRLVTLSATTSTSTDVFVQPGTANFAFTLPAVTAAATSCATPVTSGTNDALTGTGSPNGQTTATCSFITIAPIGVAQAYSVTYSADASTGSSAGGPTSVTTQLAASCVIPNGGNIFGQTCLVPSSLPPSTLSGTYLYGQTISLPLTVAPATPLGIAAAITGNATVTNQIALGGFTNLGSVVPGLSLLGASTPSLLPTGTVTFAGLAASIPVTLTPLANGLASSATLVSPPGAAVTAPGVAVTANPIPAGSYTLNLAYSGDANHYSSSSSTLSFTIGRATPSVALRPLTVTAGVPNLAIVVANSSAPGIGNPTGIIQVENGANTPVVATAPLTASNNCAPLTVTLCGVGTVLVPTSNNYVAYYLGDSNFVTANSLGTPPPVTGLVATSSITLVAAPNPAQPNQSVVLTATVTGTNGAGLPTGSVTFTDNNSVIGIAPLVAGVATFTFTFTPGAHNIVATYSGDAVYPPSSTAIGLSVLKPAPSTTFSPTPTTTVYGQSVTLTVRLTGTAGGSALPTGTVQFLNNGVPIGSPVAIVNGVATLVLSNLPPGTNNIGVTYGGDGNFTNLTKTVGTFAVAQGQVTVALTSKVSANQETLTATLAVVAPAVGTPTGAVKFVDTVTSNVLGTATVAGGTASITVPVTGDAVVAMYSGDTNFLPASSPSSATISLTNAASYTANFAPGSIVTGFGTALAPQTVIGTPPYGTTLGGMTVTVTDSAGVARQSMMFYVSPTQLSFLIPAGTASGPATVVVNTPGGAITAAITVSPSAAALFTANTNGQGPLAAQIVTVTPGGQQTYSNTSTLSGTTQVNAPVSLSPASNTYYLLLYGTGFDNAKSVTVTIAGKTYTPSYFGPQGAYAGLDQVNVLLPQSLVGSGTVSISITVDGQTSNAGTIAIQ